MKVTAATQGRAERISAARREHTPTISYSAGVRTYHVNCPTCGQLRGISLTRKDAEAKASLHRREQEARAS